jgi:hypothetical protein
MVICRFSCKNYQLKQRTSAIGASGRVDLQERSKRLVGVLEIKRYHYIVYLYGIPSS